MCPPGGEEGSAGTVRLPAVGMATGVPQGFAKAAGWGGPSAWRQMLLCVDGSPGVSVQPRQAVDPQSGEEGLWKMVTAKVCHKPAATMLQ